MQKIKKKKYVQKSPIALFKAARRLAVHTERYFPSSICLESSTPLFVALRLAHIETQAQIALRQLTALAALTFASSRLIATLCPQRAVLTVSTDLNQKHFRDTHLTMYHHHQQQPGPPPFPSGPPQNQPPIHPSGDMMPPPVGGYQFPRPTQLPDELESALSIRGTRDMDHRLIEHLDRLSQIQNQMSSPAVGQHGNYGTNPQPKQSVDWSNYEPPTKLFNNPRPGTGLPNWNSSVGESSAPNPRGPMGRSFYTPESAGTILASFGLSNEDLEALSHYPDDQLTPDTLPFILRDLQVHKTGKPKSAPSRSPEVPSLLTVTQTEGRVIDYGHASQVKDESGPPKAFKKEPLSSERTVKMYPTPGPKLESSMGRQVRLEPAEPIKHGDRDYRRRSSEHHTSRSPPPPPRDFSAKPRHQDRDYRPEPPKLRASAEKRTVELPVSKPRPALKPARTMTKAAAGKKLPTPTMISDFSGVPPKVYPHTCSLCEMQCDQEKDWVEHLETVNHTAACRHLRTKYPSWKPKGTSREYGGRPAEPKRNSAGHSRSTSWSPPPPSDKPRGPVYKPRGKAYGPHHMTRHHPYHNKDVDHRHERPHGASEQRRPPFREPWQKREHPEGPSRGFMKRPNYDNKRFKADFTKKTIMKYKSAMKPENTTQAEDGPAAKKRKKERAPAGPPHDPKCLVYLTDIPKEATEQEVINLAGSFGSINNVLLIPLDEDEQKDQCQQASVCMYAAEDAQTFANAPNLLIRDRVVTATAAKNPEDLFSSEAEQDGADEHVPEKKGVVLIEDLPESGWTEDDLKALAVPFQYPDDIIAAKQIGKAVLIFPEMATAVEMVKVHSFSPLTVKGQKLSVKQCSPNVSLKTPVALYNCFMQSEKTKGTSWNMLIIVSNVPSTPSAASVVHKLVGRIGTVFRSLAIKNMVICEMPNAALSVAVRRHYLKFPCMIQSNVLVFSRKPDPKPLSKVIPSFLDADRDEAEVKSETETTPAAEQNENSSEAHDETQQDVEMKSEPTETEVTEDQAKEEIKEPKPKPADVKKEMAKDSTVAAGKSDKTAKSTSSPKENGTQVKPAEESKTGPKKDAVKAKEAATKAKEAKAAPEQKSPVKPSKKPPPASEKKQTSSDQSKDSTKNNSSNNSSEAEKRRAEREKEKREREARDKVRRERERLRKEREHEERSKRERERRVEPRREERKDERREEQKREWRREWERKEGRRKPYEEDERRKDDKRTHHREERHRGSSRRDTAEDDDFPFNLSDFVTVDEVGDVDNEDNEDSNPDAPAETEAEPGSEQNPENQTEAEEKIQESEPSPQHVQEDAEETCAEVKEEEPEETMEPEETLCEENTEAEEPETIETQEEVTEEEPSAEGNEDDVTETPIAEETSPTNQEEEPEVVEESSEDKTEDVLKEEKATTEEDTPAAAEETETTTAPPADEPDKHENGKEEEQEAEISESNTSDSPLPPYDTKKAVGLKYLVPMTGFFCKVCTRFFTGAKDTQISHGKTLKHYENLEKFLKSKQTSSAAESGST